MATSKAKDLAVLQEQAEQQGWKVTLTKGNHFKWVSPTGNVFFSSSTPSDINAVNQVRRDLKRRGFLVITKKKGK